MSIQLTLYLIIDSKIMNCEKFMATIYEIDLLYYAYLN